MPDHPGEAGQQKNRWPLSAPNPAFARSPLEHDRLGPQCGLKTAKHENQQKDFHHFACHIDTPTGWPLAIISAQKPGPLLLQIKSRKKSVAPASGHRRLLVFP
jgi:hypothetical protein